MAVEPRYRLIAEDLRHRIEAGDLPQGHQLPTEVELMAQHDASRNTIRDAIKLLTALGLVVTRPGQGTYVVERAKPFLTTLTGDPESSLGGGEGAIYVAEVEASGRIPTTTRPRVEIHQAGHRVASALRIDKGDSVVSRHQRRYIDGEPWSLQTSFYPMSLVGRGADRLLQAADIQEGTVTYLADACGIRQAGYQDSIAVRPPDSSEAAFFRIAADGRIPVFEVWRVAFDGNGGRVRLTVTVYPTDRNQLLVNVGKVPADSPDGHE